LNTPRKQLVVFPSDGFELAGFWDLPAGGPPFPAVICCHGFGGNHIESRRLYARLAHDLSAAGIAVFRFDHRGCGDSGGDFFDFTPAGFLQDIEAAEKVFFGDRRIDTSRMAVVGYSLGGAAAACILSRHPEVRTAVIWAGVARPELVRDRLAQYPEFQGYEERGYMDYGGWRVNKAYIDEIGWRIRPLEWIRGYPGPVLFCHGSEDDIVKIEQSHLFMSTRQNPRDRLQVLSGADHGFSTCETVDALLDTTAEWIVGELAKVAD